MLLVLAKLNLISVLSMIFSYIVVNRASFDPNNHGSISSITITLLLVAHILIPCTILISYRISRVSTSCLAIYPTSETTPTSCRFHLVFLTKQTEFQLQLIIKHTVGYLNTSLKTFEIRFFHDPLTRGIVQVGNIISL